MTTPAKTLEPISPRKYRSPSVQPQGGCSSQARVGQCGGRRQEGANVCLQGQARSVSEKERLVRGRGRTGSPRASRGQLAERPCFISIMVRIRSEMTGNSPSFHVCLGLRQPLWTLEFRYFVRVVVDGEVSRPPEIMGSAPLSLLIVPCNTRRLQS